MLLFALLKKLKGFRFFTFIESIYNFLKCIGCFSHGRDHYQDLFIGIKFENVANIFNPFHAIHRSSAKLKHQHSILDFRLPISDLVGKDNLTDDSITSLKSKIRNLQSTIAYSLTFVNHNFPYD